MLASKSLIGFKAYLQRGDVIVKEQVGNNSVQEFLLLQLNKFYVLWIGWQLLTIYFIQFQSSRFPSYLDYVGSHSRLNMP